MFKYYLFKPGLIRLYCVYLCAQCKTIVVALMYGLIAFLDIQIIIFLNKQIAHCILSVITSHCAVNNPGY